MHIAAPREPAPGGGSSPAPERSGSLRSADSPQPSGTLRAERCTGSTEHAAAVAAHICIVAAILWLQVGVVRGASERLAPGLPGLRRGWLLGRLQDASDVQWRDFRRSLPLLGLALTLLVLLSRAVRAAAPHRLTQWQAVVGLAAVCYLHGAYGALVCGLATASFALARLLAHWRFGAPAFWAVSVLGMFAVDRSGGWYGVFQGAHPALAWLDDHRGAYRWHVGWNMVQLRLISYAMDYREALGAAQSGADAGAAPWREPRLYALRQNTPRPLGDYSFAKFVAYVFYPPLYIAGPTTTFNAFTSHAAAPQQQFGARYLALYLLRLLLVLLFLDSCLHFFYPWSLAKARHLHHMLSPAEFASVGFFLLNALWLKFATIWRFFRLAALADGVEVPENMTRCMNNNYTVAGFWRNWHRSFNRWIVRYMYIPMGGRRRRFLSIWPIFLFVAFWHDMELHLLAWGVLMAAFMLPEMAAGAYFGDPRRAAWLRQLPGGKYLRAAGGTLNISLLIVANLVGFGLGTGNTQELVETALSSGGLMLIGFTFVEFFCATCLMLEVRQWEELQVRHAAREGSAAQCPALAAAAAQDTPGAVSAGATPPAAQGAEGAAAGLRERGEGERGAG
eukprot:TRINITY_DN20811_c0_g1_i1.p1 TRINITY_DN20811_c0_g1~~TRINITY_DN20811_c0_g1_i1.p1  ORF type:complete len:646 (+),score=172.40 TRINITY_DN20811_c0_g1_i1:79-1938(+)